MEMLLSVDIEEVDADYTILIDGVESPLYGFAKLPEEYGFKYIEIKVRSGQVKIPFRCNAFYPKKLLHQENYIDWFYSKTYFQNVWYDYDISFYHLFAQGPSDFNKKGAIWDYEPTLAGHLVDKETLTAQIRNLICQ
jgi:hypothetical protein